MFIDDAARRACDLPAVDDGLEARIVHGLAEARDAWHAICAQSASQHTQTYEWYDAYGRTLGASNTEWVIIILLRHNQPVGVLPLCKQKATVCRIPVRALSFPTHPDLALCDVALPAALHAVAIDRAVRKVLARAGVGWDVILLRDTPAQSQAVSRLFFDLVSIEKKTSWFSCRDGHEAIASNFSTRLRKSLKRAQKNLSARNDIAMVLGVTGPAIDEAFADFVRVEASGWKAECGSAIALSSAC
ncbi:MAG TPA: hypothetical protein VI653_02395, partial [Steroidobacteraceae bacterium]